MYYFATCARVLMLAHYEHHDSVDMMGNGVDL